MLHAYLLPSFYLWFFVTDGLRKAIIELKYHFSNVPNTCVDELFLVFVHFLSGKRSGA